MDQQTIDTYNQMSREYDEETSDFWDKFPRTFFDKFAELAGQKILDVGSGPGRDAILLQGRGLEVTCLDASEAMVELCRSKGLNSIQADFNQLPFADESFVGVWAYTSLLHIPKAEVKKPLAEIHRVLKSGGIFGLGMIKGDEEGYRESSGVNLPRWFSFYTKDELERLLQARGFEILYFESFKPKSKNYLNFIFKKSA